MQPHPYDVLTLDNGAKLIFTPCPGTKDEAVSASVATLKAAGTKMLVTLMFDDEIVRNAAEYLPAECTKQAITWVQLPIADDAAPGQEFETQWLAHKTQIIELLIGLILVSLGWPKDKVINAVQALRPKALVNPVQREYFDAFNG